jgi:DNA repair photolyase
MEENLNELIKTDNATIGTFGTIQKPKPIKSKIIKPKPVFGTKEWADRNENCLDGCSHDCKYCYAKATAVRFGHNTSQNWKNEILKPDILKKGFRKWEGKIMFPSAHDITPAHLDDCMVYLEHMLKPGNQVIIVTKPHLECVKAICQEFGWYKDKILFRFTIGSSDSNTLKFWEPNAPDFAERLESLKYAFSEGYQTSVSCEPMLDDNIGDVINQVSQFVTDSILVGKMNQLRSRLALNGENDPATMQRADQFIEWQSDGNIKQLYSRYKDNPLVKWKDSIKKVLGINIPIVSGLDI